MCADRELLLEHYRKKVEKVETEGYKNWMGYEPGSHKPPRGIDNYTREAWQSELPNVDIRHDGNWTPNRWRKDQFKNQKYTEGWLEAKEIPGWGKVSM